MEGEAKQQTQEGGKTIAVCKVEKTFYCGRISAAFSVHFSPEVLETRAERRSAGKNTANCIADGDYRRETERQAVLRLWNFRDIANLRPKKQND